MRTASDRRAADTALSSAEAPRLDGIRILVVDDHADSRDLIAFILRDVGAVVQKAQDPQQAYEIVTQWSPDVIVSDLRMFSEDGYTFIKNIRARTPHEGGRIPAVAVTGLTGDAVRMTALDSGYQHLVRKPIHSAELIAVIVSLTWQKRPRRAAQ
jgi:CheY-like chemotaxis protein